MRSLSLLISLAAATAALGQPLSCPPVANLSGRACEVYHFHVQMYRPDTRGFVEVYGIDQFASQPSCDRAREAQVARNAAVVDAMKTLANDAQYLPDRFGDCHCDMTVEKTSPNFLSAAQRNAQLRAAQEVRQRVLERLIAARLPTDSPVVRGLNETPAPVAFLGGPRMSPLPAPQLVGAVENSPDDLKAAKSLENLKAPVAMIDLPLVDVGAQATAGGVPQAAEAARENGTPAADVDADAFITLETRRIQDVLKASDAVTDEALKAKILQSCMQRIQLLSNLRSLIEGSGARSRLATEAREAREEPQRLALVTRLFGSDMDTHWAPPDPSQVILPPMADSDADPERVLRDTTNHFSDQQKRRALYVLLARSQPTEEQQLWLSTIVDGLLQ